MGSVKNYMEQEHVAKPYKQTWNDESELTHQILDSMNSQVQETLGHCLARRLLELGEDGRALHHMSNGSTPKVVLLFSMLFNKSNLKSIYTTRETGLILEIEKKRAQKVEVSCVRVKETPDLTRNLAVQDFGSEEMQQIEVPKVVAQVSCF